VGLDGILRPIGNRPSDACGRRVANPPQDAIWPRNALRASSQQSAFSVQLLNQACDGWLGALTAGGLYKIVAARKEYEGQ